MWTSELNIFMGDGAGHDWSDEAGHIGNGVWKAHQGPGIVGCNVSAVELSG